jgi:hypothetical protein
MWLKQPNKGKAFGQAGNCEFGIASYVLVLPKRLAPHANAFVDLDFLMPSHSKVRR